jgi:SOS response associated peptidase (SRAP)
MQTKYRHRLGKPLRRSRKFLWAFAVAALNGRKTVFSPHSLDGRQRVARPSLRSAPMCGRYTTAADRVKFDDIFKPAAVEKAVEKAVGRYNVAPTQQVAIITRTAEEEERHA